MLKSGIQVSKKKGLHYIIEDGGRLQNFKPWLGYVSAFFYDFIMKKSIFPRKFGGDINRHYKILSKALQGVHEKRVLEIATGTGSAVHFLPNDNHYTGTDISPGLLRKAVTILRNAGYKNSEFYVTPVENLPFEDNLFDMVLCILSLNFFSDLKKALQEVKRVSVPNGIFICSVPVPERNKLRSAIRGTLYSEEALKRICKEQGMSFETIPAENGVLLYFRAAIL